MQSKGQTRLKSLHQSVNTWAQVLKQNTYALYLAYKDPRVPLLAKMLIGIVVAYALSPIDLIPDFIPLIGYLDDLLLLPIGVWLAIKLIPDTVWAECQRSVQQQDLKLPKNRGAAIVIVIIWLMAIIGFGLWVRSLLGTIITST